MSAALSQIGQISVNVHDRDPDGNTLALMSEVRSR
jgi:hypothetical protein